ncbi:hypothetical protein V8C35DRAFT_305235 [Trichoderma chlorosporum]
MAARITARRFLSPLSQARRPLVRNMATAPRSHEFVLIIPDKPGPEVRAKRLQVRPQHFSDMTPTIQEKGLKMGGGLLNDVPADDNDANTFDFAGSIMVLVAESKEDAINKVKDDIYVRSGVWDLEKAQVYAYKNGFRLP